MSNPLHKLSFIFNVTQEQPIAIGIFTLLIVKDIKKECQKMFPKLWSNSICSNKYPRATYCHSLHFLGTLDFKI
jgi:isopentenyldiphosphate isomerase